MTLLMSVIIKACFIAVFCQEDMPPSYGVVSSPNSKGIVVAPKQEPVLQPVSSPDNGTQYDTQPGFESEYVSFSDADDELSKGSSFAFAEADLDVKDELGNGTAPTENIDSVLLQNVTAAVSDSKWSQAQTAKEAEDTVGIRLFNDLIQKSSFEHYESRKLFFFARSHGFYNP